VAAVQFANAAETTLNGAITSGATSLVVAAATGFPTTVPFTILVYEEAAGVISNPELLQVGAVAGTTFSSLTRAVEPYAGVQTAISHVNGAKVAQVLTARTVLNAPGWLDVRAYGATGNGTTNDAPAIQAAINAAVTGDTVYVPTGRYLLNTGLTITGKQIGFLGAGPSATTFLLGGNIDAISVNVGGAQTLYVYEIGSFSVATTVDRSAGSALRLAGVGHTRLAHIVVDYTAGGRPYDGVTLMSGCFEVHLQDVRASRCVNNGLHLNQDGAVGEITETHIVDCVFNQNQAVGIRMTQASNTSQITSTYIEQTLMWNNAVYGLFLYTTGSAGNDLVFLNGVVADQNGFRGVQIECTGAGANQQILFHNCYVSGNVEAGVVLSGTAARVEFKICTLANNGKEGIVLNGTQAVQIIGCSIYNNNTAAGGYYGISITAMLGAMIEGCRIFNTGAGAQNGISIDASSSDTELINNYLDTGGATTRLSNSGTRTRQLGNVTDASLNQVTAGSDLRVLGLAYANTLRVGASATAGHVLTGDASGNATYQALPADPDKVIRVAHTFAVQGEIKVPSGSTDVIPGMYVSLAAGEAKALVACRHKIGAGTSATVKVQKNGVDITGWTGISVTPTDTTTNPADSTLADGDYLQLVVTAVSATPTNLSFSLFIEATQ
jgi:Right handed beta helix region/Pectate lyase superfamily protein